jgi:cyclopropane fatty-acyl-phospholipid synthase-like methyltransferase
MIMKSNFPTPAHAPAYSLTDEMLTWLANPSFPRAAKYDPAWMLENDMGPHVLWMTEWALQVLELKPGQRILDLGCGRAVSSMFLAREIDAQVWAADLWIPADENLVRVEAAGLEDQVFPVGTEAHSLPFEEDFFDVIISVDAYQYFGTDDLYLGYINRFLKPGGSLVIVVPSLTQELSEEPPRSLMPYWEWDFCCFHSADWWRHHWTKTGLMQVQSSDVLEDGWLRWLEWTRIADHAGVGPFADVVGGQTAEMLEIDRGEYLCFSRVLAQKPVN